MSKANTVKLQSAALDIWSKKYQLRDRAGNPVDKDISETFLRVAKNLASVEASDHEKWAERFYQAMVNGAVPAGRIVSNVGAGEHKPATSTINCTVSGTIPDSMDGILEKVHEAGLTLKAGCGIGYEFSTLRPKDAWVKGAGATTSGPLSFMDIYDKMCFTVSSAGGRRGAQMATFDVSHPDVFEFIKVKREDGRLRQFNLSLLITEDFVEAVKNKGTWDLVFPVKQAEAAAMNSSEFVWKYWPESGEDYVVREDGKIACRVYRTVKAESLWNAIMSSTYDFAEPGFILIDKINEQNNLWWDEWIRATNPCGEQPLPEYGACLLGSVNLTKFVRDPFTAKARFDWESFEETVAIFTRMLDNVVELNGLPLKKQRDEIARKRRHGMGYLGLGSAITMMRMHYGDEASIKFTEEVSRRLALTGWKVGVELAKEKGMAPILAEEFVVTAKMLAQRPEMVEAGFKVGDKVPGRVLHAQFSRYMQTIGKDKEGAQVIADMMKYGCRFSHHTSIAPTGTIALSLGNNASNGIEPSFGHHYSRNIIREGKKTKEKVDVYSYELLAYRDLVNPDAMPFSQKEDEQLPDYFVDSSEISPEAHVDIQAAAQQWIDSAISKTINVPTEIEYDAFKGIYLYAYEKGLKGCTTFRFNPENFQGVLVKESDLENTTYQFTLEGGEVVELQGNEEVEYDGEMHTAANLFDALKEGYYGKF